MPQTCTSARAILKHFNPSKFIAYTSLLVFSVLFSLKLDNKIDISYLVVFSPLWIWKSLTFFGGILGIIAWVRNPHYRASYSCYKHFKIMVISLSVQFLLCIFEILVCYKLAIGSSYTWTQAFFPLLLLSVIEIPVCSWSMHMGREVELELFAAINVPQIICLALKLDEFIELKWMEVFLPSWLLFIFSAGVVLFTMLRNHLQPTSAHMAPASYAILLTMLMFLVALTNKLDSPPNVETDEYFAVCQPLFIALVILASKAFKSRPTSLWWFGWRTDFCTYIIAICPRLVETSRGSGISISPFDEPRAYLAVNGSDSDIGPDSPIYIATDFELLDDDLSIQGSIREFFISLEQIFFGSGMARTYIRNFRAHDRALANLVLFTRD